MYQTNLELIKTGTICILCILNWLPLVLKKQSPQVNFAQHIYHSLKGEDTFKRQISGQLGIRFHFFNIGGNRAFALVSEGDR